MTLNPAYRRILHKMGYYNYQQGLIYRHLNQDKGWISHEQHCRNFIIKALDYYKPGKVTVYGSGWLLDLPLAEMAERVNRISLVDIIHPPEVITQTAGFKNIQLVEEDVTGGLIEEVWKKAGNKTYFNRLTSLSSISIPEYQPVDDPGLTISLNILTQLETLPEKLLKKKSRVSEEDFMNFRKEIQLKHIKFLEKHKSVIISDIAEVFTRVGGDSFQNNTVVTELPAGMIREDWIWDFDLLGDDYIQKKSVLKVAAIML
ncbi:MAG: hypothetical protein MUC93_01750 [Bacteroidales bacterium]|jgi:hypothetical protein|nr:hypothetical protein [Bacteroidales bacterium]